MSENAKLTIAVSGRPTVDALVVGGSMDGCRVATDGRPYIEFPKPLAPTNFMELARSPHTKFVMESELYCLRRFAFDSEGKEWLPVYIGDGRSEAEVAARISRHTETLCNLPSWLTSNRYWLAAALDEEYERWLAKIASLDSVGIDRRIKLLVLGSM